MEKPASDPLERRYWCFISYRHADNRDEGRQWASWLHQQIETYGPGFPVSLPTGRA